MGKSKKRTIKKLRETRKNDAIELNRNARPKPDKNNKNNNNVVPSKSIGDAVTVQVDSSSKIITGRIIRSKVRAPIQLMDEMKNRRNNTIKRNDKNVLKVNRNNDSDEEITAEITVHPIDKQQKNIEENIPSSQIIGRITRSKMRPSIEADVKINKKQKTIKRKRDENDENELNRNKRTNDENEIIRKNRDENCTMEPIRNVGNNDKNNNNNNNRALAISMKVGNFVWAKMVGWPYWPSIVSCIHLSCDNLKIWSANSICLFSKANAISESSLPYKRAIRRKSLASESWTK